MKKEMKLRTRAFVSTKELISSVKEGCTRPDEIGSIWINIEPDSVTRFENKFVQITGYKDKEVLVGHTWVGLDFLYKDCTFADGTVCGVTYVQ